MDVFKRHEVWGKFTIIDDIIPYDLNTDGTINRNDAIALMDFYLGKNPNTINPNLADVNNDGKISMADANLLLNYSLGRVVEMKLSKISLDLPVGSSETLTAEITKITNTDNACIWTSSDASIATVDNNGRVTGLKEGTAIITCTANDDGGVKAECAVKVTELKDLTLDNWTSTNVGKASSSDSHTWTFESIEGSTLSFDYMVSSEKDYDYLTVTLDGNQIIKESGEKSSTYSETFTTVGNHTLKATYTKDYGGNEGSDKASLTNIKVTKILPVEVTEINLNKTNIDIYAGASETLASTVLPENATNKSCAWTSSDASIATVSNTGLVTAVGAGECVITCTAKDGSGVKAECKVAVKESTKEEQTLMDKTIYSWISPNGAVQQTGGTITYVNGIDERISYKVDGTNYYTICLNGKKTYLNYSEPIDGSGYMEINFDEPLKGGDVISFTAFYNKSEYKNTSAYIVFENGTTMTTATLSNSANIALGGSPKVITVTVPEEADGAKSLKMTRDASQTNFYITKLEITGKRID